MDSTTKVFEESKPDAVKDEQPENQIQELYFDLLSCLGGGDHPGLPQGYKMKPMTGFLNIVEAFSGIAKLPTAGSGIVFEVGSKESVPEISQTTTSEETLEPREFNQNANEESLPSLPCSAQTVESRESGENTNTDSLQNLLCSDDSQRQSSAYSNESGATNTTSESSGAQLSVCRDTGSAESQRDNIEGDNSHEDDNMQKHINKLKILDENDSKVDAQHKDKQNMNIKDEQKQCHKSNEMIQNQTDSLKNQDKLQHANSDTYFGNPKCIEVGQPVTVSDSLLVDPVNREMSAMEKEMQKYSDELREIERLLKEHLVSPLNAFPQSAKAVPDEDQFDINHNKLEANLTHNTMVHTLADGLLSPSQALEMMYDMESNEAACKSPSIHTSTYDSCTSFTNQASSNSFLNSKQGSIRSSPSIYLESLSMTDSGNRNFSKFMAGLDSSNPPFSESEFKSFKEGDHLLAEMVNKFTSKVDINGNDISYYSINEESDVQEFADADSGDPTTSKKKRKKKIHFSDKPVSSEEDEHLWSSPSCSDYEDVDNGEED